MERGQVQGEQRIKMKRFWEFISSKTLLSLIIVSWVIYYVTSAVWTQEAFATFVVRLEKNIFFQSVFVIFLVSLLSNIVKVAIETKKRGMAILILWVIFPLGVLLFFAGFFISASSRNMQKEIVIEGSVISLPWTSDEFVIEKIKSNLKEETLDIEEDKGFFAYEPKVLISSGSRRYTVGVFPPENIRGTYFHILQFGMAPGLRLKDKNGVIEEGAMPLRILPPGAEDEFKMSNLPYRFRLRIAPERFIEKGDIRAKVYSLSSPSYEVTIYKGEDKVFGGNSKNTVSFDGLTLEFIQPGYWVILDIVKDYGAVTILAGLLLITIGVPISLGMAVANIIKHGLREV